MVPQVEHLSHVLKAIRKIKRLFIDVTDEQHLIEKICDSLVEMPGYNHAWIALLHAKGGIRFATSGMNEPVMPTGNRPEKEGIGRSQCVTKAIEHDRVVVVEDPVAHCSNCPLSSMHGGGGAMGVRLSHGNSVYGLMCVSVAEGLLNRDDEQMQFQEIADDIGYKLNNLRLAKERDAARRSLRKSGKRFMDLVESSLTCISIIKNHRVIYQNASETGLFGPISNAFVPPDFLSVHPDDRPRVKMFYQKLLTGTEENRDMDYRFYPQDAPDVTQNMRWVYCRATEIDYDNSKAILVNLMDATEAKEVEHLIRIEEKMSSLGRVAAGIAHEIRNPLSGIYIYLNNLKKIYQTDPQSDKVYDILAKMQAASGKIESIIKRVMDFSKPSHPRFVLASLDQYIEEAIQLSSVALRKSNIVLEVDLADDLPSLHTDPQMIEEVILNLITNAMEAMKDMEVNKQIRISSEKTDKAIALCVADSGPGISPELHDKIFDPFYTTKTNSSGIGLSICHRIISDHGGTLNVGKSALGGAEFIIELPLTSIGKKIL